nr:hypothetical protein [Zea mays]
MAPDTRNAASTPAAAPKRARTGRYTQGRSTPGTMRFHRRPQKSRREEARYGRSNCGSSSAPSSARASAAADARKSSSMRYTCAPSNTGTAYAGIRAL